MSKYYFVLNGKSSDELGINVTTRPTKPAPEREFEAKKLSNGTTLYRDKGYNDLTIDIQCNFVEEAKEWEMKLREVKRFINSKGNNKLIFSDDLDIYYRVKKASITSVERSKKKICKFTASFLVEPYSYENAEEEILLGSTYYNDGELSKPIYRVVGEGFLTMLVNGKEIKANIGQELIIDTTKGLCYRDGDINNVALSGAYEDLYLKEGENTFTYTSGFRVYIQANRRYL